MVRLTPAVVAPEGNHGGSPCGLWCSHQPVHVHCKRKKNTKADRATTQKRVRPQPGLHRVSPCRGLAPRSPPGSASTTGVSLARLAAVGRPRRPTPSGCRRPVLAAAATHRSHASAESPNSSRRLRSGPAGHLVAPSARCSNAEPPPLPWSAPSRRVAGCLASQPRSLASPPRPASSRAASLSRPHALRLLGRGRAGPASPSPPRPLAEQHHLASPSPLRTQPPRRTSAPLRARACAQTRPASLRQITSKLALPRPRFTLAASRRPYGRAVQSPSPRRSTPR